MCSTDRRTIRIFTAGRGWRLVVIVWSRSLFHRRLALWQDISFILLITCLLLCFWSCRILNRPLCTGKSNSRTDRCCYFRQQMLRIQREPGRVIRRSTSKMSSDRRRYSAWIPRNGIDVSISRTWTAKNQTQDSADLDRRTKRTWVDLEDVEMGKR